MDKAGKATPGVEKMKALGHWNEEWDPLLFLDPGGTDQYMSYQEHVQGRCHGGRNYGSSEARSARSSGLQLGYHNPCGRTGARRREQARDGMSK